MKNKLTLIEFILLHKQMLIVATGILVIFGIIGLTQMPRDEFPQFKIRQGIIVGVYPGASSGQVREQLTKKVENYLFSYEQIDKEKTYTVSKENVMVTYVELRSTEDNPEAFWAKLRHGLNELKSTLPSGVMSLTADNDFGNTSAILLAVESESKTYKELEKYVERFEDKVRKIPATSRVKHYGLQNEQITIYMDDAKLTQYGIKPVTIFSALKPEGDVHYSGDIDNGKFIRPIHIPSNYKSESDIANQIVYSDPVGTVVRMKDVARIVREYADPDSYIRVNGKKCLIVSLEMMAGHNIVRYGDDVKKEIENFSLSVPQDVHVLTISDMPDFVSAAIENFLKEFFIAIAAVILVTLLLLPKRVALVAASSIPVSILITIGIMWAAGMDLQTVSLAGLIIVLGMVVDNAIVIIDNYIEKLDENISPFAAASQSVTDLFGSVFSATLIIIMSFFPMQLFMTGMAGDFLKSLPLTVTFALGFSLLVAVLIVPLMCYTFIKMGIKGDHNKGRKAAFLNGLQKMYDKVLEKSFGNKKMVVGIGVLSFILGLVFLAETPQQSFPPFERNQFAVEFYLPEGSSLQQTDEVMKNVESKLIHDPRVINVASFVGTSSPRFNTLYAPNFPARHYGQMVVITKSKEATLEILDEYSEKYSDCYPNAYVRWKQLDMMAAKGPIEVRISGDSIKDIKSMAEQVKLIMQKTPGAQWIRTDFEQPLQSVRLDIKEDEATRLGYSKTLLGYSLMVGTKGFPVSTIWEGDYPVSVLLKVDKKTKTGTEDIMNQYVTSPYLISSVPVRQIADLKPEWTEGAIVTRNGVNTITVRCDVKRGIFAAGVFSKVRDGVGKLHLPQGLSIAYGGEEEQGVENMTPMYYALGVTIVIIFVILLAQFRKVKTAFLIMTTMPLSIFGASFGVFATGYPFSITAFVGLISLMGIGVRNGIILIQYAEKLLAEGHMTIKEATMAAAKRRMRPIFLTSAAAAVGVIPMILSRSPLWGPLGSVICFGLIFGMLLCLLVLPVLYYLVNRNYKTEDTNAAAL
ncbi:MAG: efflux RND transporter permease subunit [Bacteroidota bacterium]